MENEGRTYVAIDLKSFYASVECVSRGLDPLNANLVVADPTRTQKTICLAVSPSLKRYGIPGRARLFEVVQKVKELNAARRREAGGVLRGKSALGSELDADPGLAIDFIVAPPRMGTYMAVSTGIFDVYAKYVSPDDIHVYSVDEVFIDATQYLRRYGLSARDFTMKLVKSVLKTTGITATAGIGTNMFLAKIAMDIEAKHIPADRDGVRIAELTERSYREKLWGHTPITDFWRVGKGTAARLEREGMFTMGDVARCSLKDENKLYSMFGVNAELLIDHAWGVEPCTIDAIKKYRPESSSLSTGQVLKHPYDFEKGLLIVKEMTDLLVLDMVEKKVVTDQMVLNIGYDIENMKDESCPYSGSTETDRYGRAVPKMAHGSVNLGKFTSSTKLISEAVAGLYARITDRSMTIRRVFVIANHVTPEAAAPRADENEQLDMFTDYESLRKKREEEEKRAEREKKRQETIIGIRNKFGKNAILRGMNLEEDATTVERNGQVGGHKA